MSKRDQYRIRFVIDEDARFEECNGEARPLTEEEYAENQYRSCPDHRRAGSGPVGAAMGRIIVGCRRCGRSGEQYTDVPYKEYLAYYGNPDRHVYVCCDVERQCRCCGKWERVGGTCGMDLMDDDPALRVLDDWLTPAQIDARELGYLAEVAREDLAEAQA